MKITRFHTVPASSVMLTQASGFWTTREVGEFVANYRKKIEKLKSAEWADLVIFHRSLEMTEGATELLKQAVVRASRTGLGAVALVNLSDNPLINAQSHLFHIYQELGVTVTLFNAFEPACEWLESHGYSYQPEAQNDAGDVTFQTELMDKKQSVL